LLLAQQQSTNTLFLSPINNPTVLNASSTPILQNTGKVEEESECERYG
jgi:hypothetical protein